MNRCLCIISFCSITTLLLAAPIPKALKQPGPLLPLDPGNKWEYCHPDKPDTITETREIIDVKKENGIAIVSQTNSVTRTQTFRMDDNEVATVSSGGEAYDNPRVILKANMKEGDTWDWDRGSYVERRVVGKAATVKTPAGEFLATPITYRNIQGDVVSGEAVTVWYSPGVGLVRIDQGDRVDKVLKAFTRGSSK
jgi:hypothetical protein